MKKTVKKVRKCFVFFITILSILFFFWGINRNDVRFYNELNKNPKIIPFCLVKSDKCDILRKNVNLFNFQIVISQNEKRIAVSDLEIISNTNNEIIKGYAIKHFIYKITISAISFLLIVLSFTFKKEIELK